MNANAAQQSHAPSRRRRPQWGNIIILVALISVLCSDVFAQDNVFRARRLTVSDGLTSNYTTCVFQDSKGFIWIGTREGLNKYDGYSCRQYTHRLFDTVGLQSDVITAITEDSAGNMWIATNGGGLARLERSTDLITNFQHNASSPQTPSSNKVNALHVDSHGQLWIGYNNGDLDRFDADGQSFRHYAIGANRDTKNAGGAVYSILEEPLNGRLYIWKTITSIFDPAENSFTPIPREVAVGIQTRQLYICEDPTVHEWLSFAPTKAKETYLFFRGNPLKNAIQHGIALSCGNAGLSFGCVVYRGKGRYWLPLGNEGLWEIDVDRRTSQKMKVTDGPSTALSINGAMTDRNGGVWFITNDGIFITDNRRNALHGEAVEYPAGSDSYQPVRALFFDHNKTLFAGGENGVLYQYNPVGHGFVHVGLFDYGKKPFSINSIVEDQTGTLWVSATLGPWFTYATTSGRSGAIQLRFAEYGDRSTYCTLKDSEGIIWSGMTAGGGSNKYVLARIDPQRGTIQRYGYVPERDALGDLAVWTILERDRTSLWVGTAHGLFVFNKTSRTFTDRYVHRAEDVHSLSFDNVWVLHRARDNRLWVGTWGGGLNCLDEQNRSFRHVTVDDGLPSNNIRSILEDSVGNLWVATSRGISCYNPSRNTFHNFSFVDGLFDDEYEPNSCAISPEGEFYFGGTRGVTHFFPAQLRDTLQHSPFMFSALRVFDKSRYGELGDGDTVHLADNENYFSVDYALLDYRATTTKNYEYMLEGLDPVWIDADARTSATFHSVEPGAYVFRVRVTPASGTEERKEIHMFIFIASPWWATWWFRTAVGMIGIVIIGIVIVKQKRDKRVLNQLFDDAREKERLDIAGDLHDGPLQDLYAARFFLPHATPDFNPQNEGDPQRLDSLFRKVIRTLQTITSELQMPRFDMGFATELQDSCAAFQERHPEMDVRWDEIQQEVLPLPKPVMQNIFRIFRTALSNVEKHSGATSLIVTLTISKRNLALRIVDNGRGFTVSPRQNPSHTTPHFGMLLMHAYADAIHADVTIQSMPDHGTDISVTVVW